MAGAPEQPSRGSPPGPGFALCRDPESEIPDTLSWTVDRCATFLAVPDVVTDDFPEWRTERARLYSQGRIGLGDAMLVTFNPARMNGELCPPWNRGPTGDTRCLAWHGGIPNGEVCAFYGGALATDESGQAFGVFGVRPEPRANYPNETAVCHVHVLTEQDIEDIPLGREYLRPGDAVFVGGYPTPPVVEAQFHSGLTRCAFADA